MIRAHLAGVLAVVALSFLAVSCRENEQNRPLELEPHVYRGDKLPPLSQQQTRNLQERGNLQR